MENKFNENSYTIDEIPRKLFNSQFLSDITFIVEDKNIYAHSMHLMVRSSVFQEQLEATLGEKKIIPITAYGFDVFYLFLRFIYTDQLEASDADWFYLMRLAKEYNVKSLVEMLKKTAFEKKMFWVMEKQKIVFKSLDNIAELGLFFMFEKIMNSDAFLSFPSDVIEDILKIDAITNGVSEFVFGDALARWMNHYCEQNQIKFSECRQKFHHLVSLIRFPAMSIKEVRNITIKYPDFLTKSEIENIGAHKIYEAEYKEGIWNYVPRMDYSRTYELMSYRSDYCYAQFSVFYEMKLGGFVFGGKVVDTTIYGGNTSIIDLGASVYPGYTYSIRWLPETAINYLSRKPETSLIINAPPNYVNIHQSHETMLEIVFLKPDGSNFD